MFSSTRDWAIIKKSASVRIELEEIALINIYCQFHVMRFSDKYQQAEIGFQPEGEDVFVGSREESCMHCGQLTPWVDFIFETHICSEECSEAMWQGFLWAIRASDAKMLVNSGEYVQLGLLPDMAKPAVECPTYSVVQND